MAGPDTSAVQEVQSKREDTGVVKHEGEHHIWLRPSQRLDLSLAERARLLRLRASRLREHHEHSAAPTVNVVSTGGADLIAAHKDLLTRARTLWQQGEASSATTAAEAAVASAREQGQTSAVLASLLTLAEALLAASRFDEAGEAAEEALELARRDDSSGTAEAAAMLTVARIRLIQQGPVEAREALTLFPRLGLTWGEACELLAEAQVEAEEPGAEVSYSSRSRAASSDWQKLLKLSAAALLQLKGADAEARLQAALDHCRMSGFLWSRHVVASPFDASGPGNTLDAASAKLCEARRRLDSLLSDAAIHNRGGWSLCSRVSISKGAGDALVAVAASAQEAADFFRALGHVEGEGASLLVASRALAAGDPHSEKAADAAEAALRHFRAGKGHRRGQASALQMLAFAKLVDSRREDLVGALSAATEALEIYEDLGDRTSGAAALRSCAAAHLACKETKEALHAARAAHSLSQELGDIAAQAEARLLQADAQLLCVKTGDPDAALAAASENLMLEDAAARAWSQLRVGKAKLATGLPEDALQVAQNALGAFRGLGAFTGEVSVLLEICVPAHLESSLPARALEAAAEAVGVAKEAADGVLQAQALQAAAKLRLSMGHVNDSLRASRDALSLLSAAGDLRSEAAVHRSMVEAQLAAGSVEGALEAERAALRIFKELGDLSGEAQSLRGLAEICLGAGQLQECLQAAERAQQLLQDLRANERELEMMHWLISVLRARKRYSEALRFAHRCLELHRELQQAAKVADALCCIAELQISLQQVVEATEAGRTAEGMYQRLQDRQGEARVLLDVVSRVEVLKGEPELAQLAAKQAAVMFRACGDTASEAKALESLAELHVSAGEHAEALRSLGEAATRFKNAAERLVEARMLTAAVDVHLDIGHSSNALEAAEAALALCKQLGKEGECQLALALQALAKVHLAECEVGSPQKALRAAKEAQSLCSRLGDAAGEAATRLLLTDAQLAAGLPHEAFQEASQLAICCRNMGDKTGEAAALFTCFRAQCDSGRTDAALDTLHQALNLHWELGDGPGATRCLYALAKLHLANGDFSASLESLGEVLSMVKRYRRNERMEASVLQLAAKAMLELPSREAKVIRGLPSDAVDAATQAVEAFRTGGDMAGLASALRTLSATHLQRKSALRAASASEESCRLLRSLGDRSGEVESLLQLAVAQLEADRVEEAKVSARTALDLSKAMADAHRHAVAQELMQLAEKFDSSYRSGLWAPAGKGMAAKVASCIGGADVRGHRLAPPAQTLLSRKHPEQGAEQSSITKRFSSQKVPFERKPFPWKLAQAQPEKVDSPAASAQGSGTSQEVNAPREAESKEKSIPATPDVSSSHDVTGSGGRDSYWRCGDCGMKFDDPADGARTGADANFEWFCRACWRFWVDDHLRRARAAKQAGVAVDQSTAGKGKGKRPAARPAAAGEPPKSWSVKQTPPELSRGDLQKLTLIELYKRARSTGADFKKLSVAMDSDNPKAGLLDLLAPT